MSQLSSMPAFPRITFAFQPIVDITRNSVFAVEALVRGLGNEPASAIFEQISPDLLPLFDQACRVGAIELATSLGPPTRLNLNLIPNDLLTPEISIRTTVEAAQRCGFPLECLVLEVAEGEAINDRARFERLTELYKGLGIKLALDDFGAGYSGLNLLADFQPDQIKLDKELIKDIPHRGPRQLIVRALIHICRDLGIELIAEGVETQQEVNWLTAEGVTLFQGYFFARPGFQCFPTPFFPIPQ